MDTIGYKKQEYEISLSPRGRGMLSGHFFQLGMLLDRLVGKSNLKLSHTCAACSGREINKNYHPEAAKKAFDHFNYDLLDKVIKVKQQLGILH